MKTAPFEWCAASVLKANTCGTQRHIPGVETRATVALHTSYKSQFPRPVRRQATARVRLFIELTARHRRPVIPLFHFVTVPQRMAQIQSAEGTCVTAGVSLYTSVGKLPHNVNPAMHTVTPTAAFRTRHPETDMGQQRNQSSQQNQKGQQQEGRDQQQQQQQEQQQRNQNQQQGWQDEEE